MSTKQIGKVVQCIGAVVDVEFPRDQLPKVYDALIIDDKDSTAEVGLTLEVQQQLGDGIVRTIAMGSSDGLSRGTQFASTGAPIAPTGLTWEQCRQIRKDDPRKYASPEFRQAMEAAANLAAAKGVDYFAT